MIKSLLVLILILTVQLVSPAGRPAAVAADSYPEPDVYRAVIVTVGSLEPGEDALPYFPDAGRQDVTLRFLAGPLKGTEHEIIHYRTDNPAFDLELSPGDRVLVGVEEVSPGKMEIYVMDHVRDTPLLWMALLFVLALIVVGGLKGAKAVIVLCLTGLSVFFILIPLVLSGHSPILITVVVSAGVVTIGLIIIAGLTAKAFAASAGTVAGLIAAGLLAASFGKLAHLIGLGSQEAQMLMFIPDLTIDARGLLFAGMILGSLGAIMDVAMSIASAIEEVYRANPEAGFRSLARSGLNVGRDVLGTMSNTLILAYAGGALPLLLLLAAYDVDAVKILNLDIIATEVVRALSGSIGLILSVPVTAVIAARLKWSKRRESL